MHDQNPVPGPHRPRPRAGCPECGAPITGIPDRCPNCALPLRGPEAAELWRLDGELARLRAREADLLVRRGNLLGVLRAERARLARGVPGNMGVQGVRGTGADRAGQDVARVRQAAGGTGPETVGAGAPGSVRHPDAGAGIVAGPVRHRDSGAGAPGFPQHPGFRPGSVEAAPRRDFSPKAVQNLLLTLGGLLLVVAAVVFTVVSWGHIGIGGRAAILAGVTALTFAAPKLLVSRGLGTTAETIAMLGVALLLLDGYAARQAGLLGADGPEALHYTAMLFGLVALLTAGYSRLLPLRLPLPVAIVLAQFPFPLLVLDRASVWITAALVATAAMDAVFLAIARRAGGQKDVDGVDGSAVPGAGGVDGSAARSAGGVDGSAVPRANGVDGSAGSVSASATAGVCFAVVWVLGLVYGFLDSVLEFGRFLGDERLVVDSAKGALLVALAVIGIAVARRARQDRLRALASGSMFALAVGLAAPFWRVLPYGWLGVPHTAGALAAVAVALYLPGLGDARIRSAGASFAALVAVLTAVPFVPWTITVLLAPFTRLHDVWSWPYEGAGEWQVSSSASGSVVPALLAVASAVAALRGRGAMGTRKRRAALGFLALAAGTVAVAVAPGAFAWNHLAGLVVLLVLAVALVACPTLVGEPRWASAFTAAAVPVAVLGVVTALAARAETYAALAVLLAAWGVATFAARVPGVAATALVMAVLSATGLIWAVVTGTGWQPTGDGLALSLAVGAVLAVVLSLVYRGAAGRRATAGQGETVTQGEAGEQYETGGPEEVHGQGEAGEQGEGGQGEADGPGEDLGLGADAERRAAVRGVDPRWGAGLGLGATLAAFAVSPIAESLARIVTFYRPLFFPWTAQGDLTGRFPILFVVVALLAVTAVTVSWQVAGRKGGLRAALLALPVLLTALPLSVGLPYPFEVGLFVAGLGPSAWMAARSRTNWAFGAGAGLWTVSFALSWALAAQTATLVALPVVALVAAATAFHGRERAVRAGGAGLATLLAGGEALAAGLALEWPARYAAFGVLAVACVAAAVAGRFRNSSFAVGVEAAGYLLATVGLALTADDLAVAALAWALTGVLMAGTALRPDRRWAGYVGTALLLTASWLRLLASDITVVEAYTVPFSLVLLAFGWWRARGRALSSWAAYGTGLASSLLPSMIAMLTGEGWLRPLALGVVCLAVLLAGARLRLQAPALLGGLTLAVVALHELAPWIMQAVMAVPRWVPMALGGLLLVVVGATYEARLRDVRRLREAVGRMR
ncbi:hypothetical protein AB0395_02840 [Streptosporangium sp. NPDC051023]|uniref:SCO7613 C-terminal domain-containing membrane protein n=1 Tax=Streptosporangium sp. NPDC051023 TaxID=3155410 RepID=UPI00344BA959